MKVLVTGGTGFVGREVLRELQRQGHQIRVLLRPGSEKKLPPGIAVEIAHGDILDRQAVAAALPGCEAVIHLVGIIREFPSRGITFARLHAEATGVMVAATQAAGIRRYLHMSALESPAAPVPAYHQTKQQAEETVMGSGLLYTIFRPSVIYGPEDQFTNLLRRHIEVFRLVPIIGDGRYQLQPVAVWQVAQAFVQALINPKTVNKSYDVGGPEPVSFVDLVDTLAQVLGRRVWKIHLPAGPLRAVAGLLQYYPWFPVTPDQITMLLAGNTCDPREFYQDFNLEPLPLAQGLASYLAPAP